MRKKSLVVNAFLNGLRSVLNILFPLITFPYVTRVLSVNGIGIYNFSNTYVGYFVLIAGLGISTYAVREGAKYRDDIKKISNFSSQIFSINIYSTIIAYLLLLLSLIVFKNLNNYISCILIFSLQILFTTLGTEWIYIIYEDYSYITIRSIIFKVISIFFLFIFVRKPTDYLVYAGISVFAGVGSNILNFIHARQICSIKFVNNINWRYHLKPILVIFATSVAITIYMSADTTMLGIMKSDYDVGIYSTSVKIYTIIATLLGAISTVTIPRLAMLYGKKRFKEYKKILSELINTLNVIVLPGTVGLIMLSKDIVLIIAGEKYLPAVNSLQLISLAMIFSNFSMIFNQCVLIPAKRENKSLRNTIVTALINIILNVVFIPYLSYNGTALSTTIAEFMVMFMNGWSGRDIIKDVVFSRRILKNISTSVLGCLGIILICSLCRISYTSLVLRTVMSVILSVGIYMAILVLVKNEIIMSYMDKLRKRKLF
ncbi:flippase [Lactobacillus johnsonii]|uniref:flippase n=1 Tax=Lactobacillus johnsonii TaxID=33959 RepID=UPI003DA5DBEE